MLPDGESVVASQHAHHGVSPLSRFLLRSAQKDLKEALYPHIQERIDNNHSRLLSVMKWVDLEQLRERLPVVAAITPAVEEPNIKRSTLLAKSNGLPRSC